MSARLLVSGVIIAVYCLLALVFPSAAFAQQKSQPQFTSGGIRVVVNRAVRPKSAPQVVLSLVMTNMGDDEVSVYVPVADRPMLITDTGASTTADRLSGIPLSSCLVVTSDSNNCIGRRDAVVIDKYNSITITAVFEVDRNAKFCSLDFSMPIRMQRGTSGWRLITVGLPNVMVC